MIRTDRRLADQLSAREKQVLSLAAQGQTDQAIAIELGISLATVNTYWGRIRIKFGPLNRTELVATFLRDEAKRTISRLKEDNARLIAEVQDKSNSLQQTEESVSMFRALFSSLDEAVVIVDKDATIVLTNNQADDLFGYHPGELNGKSVDILVPDINKPNHRANRIEYMTHPEKRKMGEHDSITGRHKHGHTVSVAAALAPLETSHGTYVACLIRPII